jgi:hypothetical protein
MGASETRLGGASERGFGGARESRPEGAADSALPYPAVGPGTKNRED